MRPASLQTLIRVRRQAVDAASLHLSACLETEAASNDAVRAQAADINRQRAAAESAASGDGAVEAFGIWYPLAQDRLRALAACHARTVAETARARAQLSAARIALEAVETLSRETEQARRAKALHDEQRQIDEAASRHGPVRDVC
jgi:flagellar export protein FliJ